MISKNIDVIAVAVLLAVIALYSEARKMMPPEVIPNHAMVAASHASRATRCIFTKVLDTPVPPLSPLSFSR
ncbi:MAG: hypothetical protein JWP08_909 [Bryobacterales bacterium]|jgi:hypothetical protein|nr:hypothetical protein [Bryobacterales bacterium]